MISIEAEVWSELQVRLAQDQIARARVAAEQRALPPTRPQGAARMWLPDEGDGGD